MRCNAPLLAFTMLYLLTSHVLDLRAALVSTYFGSVSTALLPGLERLPTRTHSPTALQKSVQLENTTVSPFFALTPEWEEQILKKSMAHSTVEACPRLMLAYRARSRAFGNCPPLLFTVHALFCAARWKTHRFK